PSEWSRLNGKTVATLFQFPTNRIRQSGFDLQLAVEGKAARLFHRGLDIQPAIQNRRKKTRMTGCLIMPAHDSERHRHPAVFPQHSRNDRMHRALARPDGVRMRRVQAEGQAPAVEQYTRFGIEPGRSERVK